MGFVKKFSELNSSSVMEAGGKGASLGEMTRAGIPVPSGFVVLSQGFDQFLHKTGIKSDIDSILNKVDTNNVYTVEKASEDIKGIIMSEEIPDDIKKEVLEQYKKLNADFVAVRSSATAEDSASAAWAGQLDSFLNTTEKNLLKNVKRCWASLFTPRAIFYRFEQNLHKEYVSVAVVVQKMVASDVSGIAFSVHPVTEDYNQLIIEAGYGLGEAIVSGQITPDSYVVLKRKLTFEEKIVANQERKLERGLKGGVEWKKVFNGENQKLTDEEIIELSKLIIKIEKHYGFPCDIEWAQENGELYIVQSRPITTLMPEKRESSFDKLLDKINKEELNIQKADASFLMCHFAFDNFVKSAKEFGVDISLISHVENNYFSQIYFEKDIQKVAKYAYEKSKKEKSIEWFSKKQIKVDKELLDFWNSHDINKLKREELIFFFEKIVALAKTSWKYVLLGEDKGAYFGEQTRKLFKGTDEEFLTLIHPVHKSLFAKSHELILKEAINPGTVSYENYVKDFFWVKSNYFDRVILTRKVFNQMIKDERKKGIKELKQEYSRIQKVEQEIKKKKNDLKKLLTPEIKLFADYMEWSEYRNVSINKSIYYVVCSLHRIAEVLGVNYETINLCTEEEVKKSLKQGKIIISKDLLKNRNKTFMEVTSNGTEMWYGEEADILFQATRKKTTDVKGVVACKGVVKGRIKVILDPSKETLKKDEILVTSMTRVEFLPLMRNAAAIITDEGGMACHAAIVSRELGVPCIVGTKHATQSLKTGDYVEVDANTGVVKKINIELEDFLHIDVPLIIAEINNDFEVIQDIPWCEKKFTFSPFCIHARMEDGLLHYIYDMKGVQWKVEQAGKFSKKECIKQTKNAYNKIKKHIEKESALSKKELIEFHKNLSEFWLWYDCLYWQIEYYEQNNLPMKDLLAVRKETEYLMPGSVAVYRSTLKKLYPKKKKYVDVISYEETISGKFPSDKVLDKRLKGFAYSNKRLFSNLESAMKHYGVNLKKVVVENPNLLKGQVAYKGKAKGKVKILNTKKDIKDFEKGNILVASSTTPDFLPAIKKSAAIVSEHGGAICHASITSRELKIPCVVGVKGATKVLKDGDIVEVDAENGFVKKFSNEKTILKQLYSRHKCLGYMMMWNISEDVGFKDFINYDIKHSLFIYDEKTEKTSVWYDRVESKQIANLLFDNVRTQGDKYTSKIVKRLDDEWIRIFPYLSRKKKIKTEKEFNKFYKGITMWWSAMNTVYPLMQNEHVSKKHARMFLKYREHSEKYTGAMDELIIEFWSRKVPKKYQDIVFISTVEELKLMSKGKLSKTKEKEIKERRKGFIIFNKGTVLKKDWPKFLEKNNFKLYQEKIEGIISVKGTVAYKGKVIGRVKKIIKKSDIKDFKKGEVLVAEITFPDHVPAMKKAAAFVTDEGGVTCHAAIVSRELKKPCIIGTVKATKVFKDGDLVEVDANTGVVLKVEETLSFEKAYTRDTSYIMQEAWSLSVINGYKHFFKEPSPYDFSVLFFMTDGVIQIWENQDSFRKYKDRLLQHNRETDFDDHLRKYNALLKRIKVYWKKKVLKSSKELEKFLEFMFIAIEHFALMYETSVDERTPKKTRAKALKVRAADIFFDKCDKLIRQTLANIYPKLKGLEATILRSEIAKPPKKELLEQRKKNSIMITNKLCEIKTLDEFEKEYSNYNFLKDKMNKSDSSKGILKGQIAFRGKVKGVVKMLKRKEQISELKKGEVLVSAMTTPDFLPAIKKASAIVTDEGGITCHAAIVSREMQIPCIIGTKFATTILKDGDLVEVDAEKGVVTKIDEKEIIIKPEISVLHVEDDLKAVNSLSKKLLKKQIYYHNVDNLEEAFNLIKKVDIQILICDGTFPIKKDGAVEKNFSKLVDFLKKHQNNTIPICWANSTHAQQYANETGIESYSKIELSDYHFKRRGREYIDVKKATASEMAQIIEEKILNLSTIKEELNKPILYVYEEPGYVMPIVFAMNVRTGYFHLTADIDYNFVNCIFKRGTATIYLDPSNDKIIADNLFNKVIKENFFPTILNGVMEKSNSLLKLAKSFQNKDFSNVSNEKLSKLFAEFYKRFIDMRLYSSLPTAMEHEAKKWTNYLVSILQNKISNDKELNEVFSLLTTPEKNSYLKLFDVEVSKLAIGKSKYDAKSLAKNYAWIRYTFEGKIIDEKYVQKEISKFTKEEHEKIVLEDKNNFYTLKKKKDLIYGKYSFTEEEKKYFSYGAEVVWLKFYRKGVFAESYYSSEFLQREMAKRIGLSEKQIKHLLVREVLAALITRSFPSKIIAERMKGFFMFCKNGKSTIFPYDKKQLFDSSIIKQKINAVLKGRPAYNGKITGMVKIVNSPKEIRKVKKGDILVSRSTNPNLLPAMKKAGAFLTDTGGLTCHAAIVSRELKKPCIVGTKNATKTLKDGDLVELDADKGVVRKLK